jgi:hypothetical protein
VKRFDAEKGHCAATIATPSSSWQACALRHCRKARACRGDAAFCLRRRLAEIPREARRQARHEVLAAALSQAGPAERMAREFLPEALI